MWECFSMTWLALYPMNWSNEYVQLAVASSSYFEHWHSKHFRVFVNPEVSYLLPILPSLIISYHLSSSTHNRILGKKSTNISPPSQQTHGAMNSQSLPRCSKQRSCIWAQQCVCWHDFPDLALKAHGFLHPRKMIAAGTLKITYTPYCIPGTQMTLVLIGKRQSFGGKQRTNGFQVYDGVYTPWN